MKSSIATIVCLLTASISAQHLVCQSAEFSVNGKRGHTTVDVENVEPAMFSLKQMFASADVVAIVQVVAGDAENYPDTVYKAKVIQSFKGVHDGQTIYFGPYQGNRLGSEYVVFLRKAPQPERPSHPDRPGFGTVPYLKDFDQGYTTMEISYECSLGEGDIEKVCDYAVSLSTDYVTLPGQVQTYPPKSVSTPFGRRFVRKSNFVYLLDDLAAPPGTVHMP